MRRHLHSPLLPMSNFFYLSSYHRVKLLGISSLGAHSNKCSETAWNGHSLHFASMPFCVWSNGLKLLPKISSISTHNLYSIFGSSLAWFQTSKATHTPTQLCICVCVCTLLAWRASLPLHPCNTVTRTVKIQPYHYWLSWRVVVMLQFQLARKCGFVAILLQGSNTKLLRRSPKLWIFYLDKVYHSFARDVEIRGKPLNKAFKRTTI